MTDTAWSAVEPAQWGAQSYAVPVHGPAYSRAFRFIALAVVLALAAGAAVTGSVTPASGEAGRQVSLALVVLAMMAIILIVLWRSVTTIDAEGIRQSGLLEKRVAWNEIRRTHLLRVGLTPRLVVRTSQGRLRVFYAGTAELRDAVRAIAAAQRAP